jgi:hypothetical protein
MIRISALSVHGFPEAIRGMRNPYNSWDKSDSRYSFVTDDLKKFVTEEGCTIVEVDSSDLYVVGPKDKELMKKLVAGGPVHAKFRRMITVAMDITAPLYWWKEFDTYKVGTVANSCSTMHTIMNKEFTLEDFSCEHLIRDNGITIDIDNVLDWDDAPSELLRSPEQTWMNPEEVLKTTIVMLNKCREKYIETKDKKYWWQIIQLLPSSYNQTRTVMLNYEVLSSMYHSRKNHKLDEWKDFCRDIETILPMANELICK